MTCAIRPSGIFGIGDLAVLPRILDVYFRSHTKVQINNNQNLFNFYREYERGARALPCRHRAGQMPERSACRLRQCRWGSVFHHKGQASMLLGLHVSGLGIYRGYNAAGSGVGHHSTVGVLSTRAGRTTSDKDKGSAQPHDEIYLYR